MRQRTVTTPYTGRREDERLLTGAGRYTADWNQPGQRHAAFLRADRAHAAHRRHRHRRAALRPACSRC